MAVVAVLEVVPVTGAAHPVREGLGTGLLTLGDVLRRGSIMNARSMQPIEWSSSAGIGVAEEMATHHVLAVALRDRRQAGIPDQAPAAKLHPMAVDAIRECPDLAIRTHRQRHTHSDTTARAAQS